MSQSLHSIVVVSRRVEWGAIPLLPVILSQFPLLAVSTQLRCRYQRRQPSLQQPFNSAQVVV
jgi:hypothetical protein